MKKILFVFFVLGFLVNISAQVYDEPFDSTAHYRLRLYQQSDRVPYYILNEDKQIIDSVLFSLIVALDSTQNILIVDTTISTDFMVLKISNYATGSSAFTTTAQTCTVTVAGADTLEEANDIILLTAYGSVITSNDVLSYAVVTNTNQFVVYRPASGTSGLKFKWRWIKRY